LHETRQILERLFELRRGGVEEVGEVRVGCGDPGEDVFKDLGEAGEETAGFRGK
jgi:hypothetical protein